jgi:hypothetical protein
VNRKERVALSVAEVEMAIGASVGNSIGSSQATAVVMPEIRQIEIPPSVSTPVPAQPVVT